MFVGLRLARLVFTTLLACSAAGALAQADVRGAKDHPLLTRYPNSYIAEYAKNYNAVELSVGANPDGTPKKQSVEGNATVLTYFHKDPQKQPSALEVIRNYENAVKAIGGEVVYERLPKDGDGGEATLRVEAGGKLVWVGIEPGIFSAPTQSYKLAIVETAAMQQVVSANKMLDELNRNGFIALYINFDTNKADLKADGQATVREIVALMKGAPALRLSIEGHTDNVGAAPANKTLSENRAKSVMAAVVAGGIPAARLAAAGYGADKPIADNRSEDGRAKNRRVELVKK